MDKVFSFLISAGLIAFGILVVVFAAKTASGSSLVWTLMGLMPVVVGLISLFCANQNDRTAA
jgi:cadmium resistance protein CadD (predicted permease)